MGEKGRPWVISLLLGVRRVQQGRGLPDNPGTGEELVHHSPGAQRGRASGWVGCLSGSSARGPRAARAGVCVSVTPQREGTLVWNWGPSISGLV